MPLRNKDRTGEHTQRTFVGSAALIVTLLAGAYCSPARANAHLTQFTVDPGPAPKTTPPGPLLVSTRKSLTIPSGSEFCGIDSIFADGVESALFIPIDQSSGGIASPGLALDINGTGSGIIGSPIAGSTTGESTVDVTGTFVGPVNTGITINGIAGYTAAGQFLVPSVPLTTGINNTLNLIATTLTGTPGTSSGSVIQGGAASPVAVAVDRPTGYAPFTEHFNYLTGALTINSVAINFKGTGSDDYPTGPLASAPTSYTYKQPGLYTAQFKFTDSNNIVYTIKRSVLIQDLVGQRSMLCDVYGYLRDRLKAQDATNAGSAFQPVVRNDFIALFNQLGTSMPATALQLGVIVDGQLGFGFADLLLVRDNADQSRSGFPLRLTLGTDGVWRISEM
jgi:hypothetical protein